MRSVQTRPDAKFYQDTIRTSECHSPSLLLSELANALWKTVRFADLTPDDANRLLSDMAAIPYFTGDDTLIAAALDIAISHDHSVYDCLFIALSRRLEAPILTADKKLRRKFPGDQFVDIKTS